MSQLLISVSSCLRIVDILAIIVHDVLQHAQCFHSWRVGVEGDGLHVGIHGSLIVAIASVLVAKLVVFGSRHCCFLGVLGVLGVKECRRYLVLSPLRYALELVRFRNSVEKESEQSSWSFVTLLLCE